MTLIKPVRRLVAWPALVCAWVGARRDRDPVRGGRVRDPGPDLPGPPDYVDRYELTTDVDASPREWATTMFEVGVPRPARELLFHRLLGCALDEDGAPGTIAGLRVVHEDAHRVLLAMGGPRVRCTLLVEVTERAVALTTAQEYVSQAGRVVWSVVGIRHRQLAAPLLREAAARLRSSTLERPRARR